MTSRTIVELHILQTVPPSNLNRDDTGTPKSAVYGGVRRARVSSQAWKRATRKVFQELLDPTELGVRTRRLAELLGKRIRGLDKSIPEDQAWAVAAATITAATGAKIEPLKRNTKEGEPEPAPEAKYLIFLSARQLDALAELAVQGRDDIAAFFKNKENKAAAKQLANSRHSVDIALFGRMVADGSDINVDAAAQVAHAISVHRVDVESDYYTAVDDHKEREEDDKGAGMIGTVEFNSATLYRYAALDVDLLRRNLGKGLREDDPADVPVRRAVEAFVRGFVESLPTGKINTFGHHTLPDAVVAKVRSTRPVNFVGAFERPCRANEDSGGHVLEASERLAKQIPAIETAFDVGGDTLTWVTRAGDDTQALSSLGTELPLGQLVSAIGAEAERRQNGAV
ncbi:type I-E CRISPR-associated protein Cas7/Cse4/CasC [Actinomadura rubrisoli]|uniref:Type I-E CRISPR-associated protein Cas7/Cse4/CasC n=1 Tax=Actinomadura rubrisoli TaxID=2530368 RepID=A0A4R5CDN5_9ACTN|nr:type I-E CRISPR-associated protein Cas7/Cse4/CasC [Actinomadura rubrisoli]TDD96410.1 type I-E CRISPR-associated protein Cas7/Cse4/CasC [Actinomadura rubrisoli]